MAGLDAARAPEEAAALAEELFQRYERHVAADPAKHGMDYVHSYLCMSKE